MLCQFFLVIHIHVYFIVYRRRDTVVAVEVSRQRQEVPRQRRQVDCRHAEELVCRRRLAVGGNRQEDEEARRLVVGGNLAEEHDTTR